MYSKRGFK